MTSDEKNHRANTEARDSLIATALDLHRPHGIGLEVEASPACRAIELACRDLGLDATPLARLAEETDLAVAVRRLGRSHGMLGRKVDLQSGWWRSNGEILVVDHQTLGPCTLVPHHGGWKAMVASEEFQHVAVAVNDTFARDCDSVAYEFIKIGPPGQFGLVGLLLRATRRRWSEVTSRIWAGVVSALLGLVLPIVTGILINQVIPDGESRGVIGIGLALLVAAGATSILGVISGLATLRLDNVVSFRTETMVFARVIDRFRRPNAQSDGEIIQRVNSVNAAMGTVTHATDKLFVQLIRGIAYLILLLYYSWVLAAVGLATLALGLVAISIEAILQNRFIAASQAASGRSDDLSIAMLEGLESIRERAIAEPLLLRWTAQRSQVFNLNYLSASLSNLRTLILTLLGGMASLLIYFLVAEHYAGDLNAGNFVASTMAISAVMSSLGTMAGVIAGFAYVAPVFDRLRPLLTSNDEANHGTDDPDGSDFRFEFEDVTVKETSWGRTDIAKCSFKIEPGRLTVIAAERSVSSKVLLQTMVGLRKPEQGRVLLDERSLGNIETTKLRELGLVLTETPQVRLATLRENLDMNSRHEDDDLVKAMEETGLKAIFDKMPLGFNTILDPRRRGSDFGTLLAVTRSLLDSFEFVAVADQPILRNTTWGRNFMERIAGTSTTRVIASLDPRLLERADRILALDDDGRMAADGDLESLRRLDATLPPSIAEAIR